MCSLLFQIGSTAIENWEYRERYPDYVAEGTGDQKIIMEAICTIKKATFDGVDCVGGDPDATGTVRVWVLTTKHERYRNTLVVPCSPDKGETCHT